MPMVPLLRGCASRVASRWLEASVRDVSWQPWSTLRGPDGYRVELHGASPMGAEKYRIEGLLWQGGDVQGQYVPFAAPITPRGLGRPLTWGKGPLVQTLGPATAGSVLLHLVKVNLAALLAGLRAEFPPADAEVIATYKGRLPVYVVGGDFKNPPRREDLRSHHKDRHSLVGTPAYPTAEEAEDALNRAARKYEEQSWPGGIATKLGLIYWADAKLWSGAYETYYSFS